MGYAFLKALCPLKLQIPRLGTSPTAASLPALGPSVRTWGVWRGGSARLGDGDLANASVRRGPRNLITAPNIRRVSAFWGSRGTLRTDGFKL